MGFLEEPYSRSSFSAWGVRVEDSGIDREMLDGTACERSLGG